MLSKVLAAASAAALGLGLASAQAADLNSMSWDDIVTQAKAEGELNWFHWYLQPAMRQAVEPFEERYGITVTIPDGSLDANQSKLLAERGRDVGDIDLISLGGDRLNAFDPTTILYGPITGILPDGANLRTQINGGDSQGYAVAFWGNQTGLAYDPTRVDEASLPQSVADLDSWMTDHPQEFAFNTENGGSGPALFQSVARNIASDVDFSSGDNDEAKLAGLAPAWEWFNAREDNFIITASNSDSLTRLNDGEFTLVAAWEDHLAGLQSKGEIDTRMKFYIPQFGMPGGGNVVGIPTNASHPAAALVFIDWLTSAETQAEFNVLFGIAPQHPDASADAALVPMEQRAYSTDWAPPPFGDDIKNGFVENVALN